MCTLRTRQIILYVLFGISITALILCVALGFYAAYPCPGNPDGCEPIVPEWSSFVFFLAALMFFILAFAIGSIEYSLREPVSNFFAPLLIVRTEP